MIIALTGTPGTGKTTIAKLLRKEYSLEVINIHNFAKKENIIDGFDEKRQSDIIDINTLDKRIKKYAKTKSLLVLDGHLSHLLQCVSYVLILRCHPIILQNRLRKKHWKKEKIQENIEAEILDIIKIEAINIHSKEHIFEINTTDTPKKKISSLIKRLIESDFHDKNNINSESIDWSELLISNDFVRGLTNNGSLSKKTHS
jgi:adenylate kinase